MPNRRHLVRDDGLSKLFLQLRDDGKRQPGPSPNIDGIGIRKFLHGAAAKFVRELDALIAGHLDKLARYH